MPANQFDIATRHAETALLGGRLAIGMLILESQIMHAILHSSVLTALTCAATAALAAEQATGEIVSIDRAALTLKLDDGNEYHFANMQAVGNARAGDEVRVFWDEEGHVRVARLIQVDFRHSDENE